jgi:hypothetical protein
VGCGGLVDGRVDGTHVGRGTLAELLLLVAHGWVEGQVLVEVCGEDVVVVLESDGGVGGLFSAEEGRIGQSARGRRRDSHL